MNKAKRLEPKRGCSCSQEEGCPHANELHGSDEYDCKLTEWTSWRLSGGNRGSHDSETLRVNLSEAEPGSCTLHYSLVAVWM